MQLSAGEEVPPLVVDTVLAVGRSAGWDRHLAVRLLDTSLAPAELLVVDTSAHRMDMAGIALVSADWLRSQNGRTRS